ncbi:hypothetical protein ACJA23_03200 [Mycoplasma corogypsi]|uniref:hypothetical protein n=1 Tax=Mycoplasma corogypsi TaxID=2106 RepID=UPI003872BFBE
MNKKLTTSLLAAATVIAPTTFLVSCGNEDTNTNGSSSSSSSSDSTGNSNVLLFKDQTIELQPTKESEVADAIAPNNYPAEKTIKFFRDAVQTDAFYAALKEFKKSQSFKDGYKIRFIDKGVFDALDTMANINLNDPQVADIFYAPGDRITNLATANQAIDLDAFRTNEKKTIFDYLQLSLGLSRDEIDPLIKFGAYTGSLAKDPEKRTIEILALQHNVEGIFMISPKEKEEALKILNNSETNSMVELAKAGKALWYTQNFWFGLGVVGGVTSPYTDQLIAKAKADGNVAQANSLETTRIIEKLVYWDTAQPSSGWIQGNQYAEKFGEATANNAKLVYPFWKAAFKDSAEQYKSTVWGQKGIQQGTLEAAMNSDGGTYLNTIFQLFKEGRLDFGMAGTWELRNAITKGGVKTIFTLPEVVDGTKYLQSPGSWSWGIVKNDQNTKASDSRKLALINWLLSIYSPNASYQYFLSDSKINIFKSIQDKLRTAIDRSSQNSNTELVSTAKDLGYATVDALKAKYDELVQPLSNASKEWRGEGWTKAVEGDNVLSEAGLNLKSLWEANLNSQIPAETLTRYKSLIQDAAPVRNALAYLFNTSLKGLEDPNQGWKINNSLLKDGLVADNMFKESSIANEEDRALVKQLFDGQAIHVRRLESAILGYNGDGNDNFVNGNLELLDQLLSSDQAVAAKAKEKMDAQIATAIANAKKVFGLIAKTMPSADKIEKAVKLMYYEFLNNGLLRRMNVLALDSAKMQKQDGTPSNLSYSDVAKLFNSSETTSVIKDILSAVTSDKSYAQGGTGIFETLPKRPGTSNPQFGAVWSTWNEKTFGNLEFFKSIVSSTNSEEEFIKAVKAQLSSTMQLSLAPLKNPNSFTIQFGSK